MEPTSQVARLRRLAGRAARAAGLRRASAPRPGADPALRQRLAKVREERDTARARLAKATAARDALRTELDAARRQLEQERADVALASGRDRGDLSYLFVVTYGRSGSTLLQGILSSVPGVMIRGENGGVLRSLFDFHQTVRHHQQRLARPEPLAPSHPWWGIDGYPEQTALRDMRTLMLDTVLRPAPDTRVVGFKEITWLPEQASDFLDFARAVFPGARFVLNTRNLDDVARSKWWAGRPDARAELEAMEQAYVRAVAALGADGFHVHYDDYVADPSSLRGLFDWLGADFDEERVRAVMAVRHSY